VLESLVRWRKSYRQNMTQRIEFCDFPNPSKAFATMNG